MNAKCAWLIGTGLLSLFVLMQPVQGVQGAAAQTSKPVKITRLARGIPSGSVLEFANREMLADALRGRQSF